MIYLYTGTPGSGKSLDMARVIWYQSTSHPVICNFPVTLPPKKMANFQFWRDEELTVPHLVEFANNYWGGRKVKEDTILLFIDEAQIYFNSRDWSSKGRKEWIRFFSGHRHYGYCIIMACQIDTMLDKQIRALVETQVIHRKINNYGWRGLLLRLLFFAPTLFVKVSLYYQQKMKLSSSMFRYSKKFASIYDSYATSFFDGSDFRGQLEQSESKDGEPEQEKRKEAINGDKTN